MKHVLGLLLGASIVAATLMAADEKKETPPSELKKSETAPASDVKEVAVIKTSAGEMVVEFWPDVAPKTVENFKKLARQGFYDGTAFHRIIKRFMIQGGDPNTKDPAKESLFGQGGPGYMIKAEFSDKKHERGVISMARQPHDVDTAGSQFFIILDPASHLDHSYSAFGKLIKGEDVLLKIGETPTTRGPDGASSKPKQRIAVESIKIVPADSIKESNK